ncbi:MAG: ComEC/Rec2 family competence protein, partial [Anaerolineae bacterium]|nr:ComEC family competence protein [Thermoflexales bacterium]MDW8408966.1 ComEC/Rec2 family competence protein [Anaerolineae bacterium]
PLWLSLTVLLVAGILAVVARRNAEAAWAILFVSLCAAGALRYTLAQPDLAQSIAAYNGRFVELEGVVIDEPDMRPDDVRLRVQVRRLIGDSVDVEGVSGLVLIKTARVIPWRYGDVVRAAGVIDAPPIFAEFNYREYLARKGVLSWMARPKEVQRIGVGKGHLLYAALLNMRAALRLSTQRIMPAPESALLNGILIGDDNEIPAHIAAAFSCTGTSHIVSISGFNVSVVIALVVPALSRLLNKRRAALIAIPAIVVYTLLVGASASVVRAALMAIIALIGQVLWRRGFTLNTLCAAAFLMLLTDPNTLYDGGFQLSVAATLGLVLYADRLTFAVQRGLERRLGVAPGRAHTLAGLLADLTLVTLAAQITTLPLILVYFHQLPLITLLTNGLILPLQPPIMMFGILGSVTGIASPALGAVAGLPAYSLLTATIRIVEWNASFDNACVPVYVFDTPHAVAYFLTLFGFTAVVTQSPQKRRNLLSFVRQMLKPGIILIATAIVASLGFVLWVQRPDGKLHVTFTGKGAFIQTPNGKHMVFAGGGGVLPVMGRAMPLTDRSIELLILPRRDDAARGETLPLLQRYRVGVVLLPKGEDEPSPMLEDWQSYAEISVRQVLTIVPGARVVLEPGVVLTIAQRADGAIGARLSYGETVFELAGDAPLISGTIQAGSVVFTRARGNATEMVQAAQPRWVIWADAGGAPPTLQPPIRALNLRDVAFVEFVSDGRHIIVR